MGEFSVDELCVGQIVRGPIFGWANWPWVKCPSSKYLLRACTASEVLINGHIWVTSTRIKLHQILENSSICMGNLSD